MIKPYKSRDIITPILEFIKSCPFLADYNIDISNMGVQKIDSSGSDGSAIEYLGSIQVSDIDDIIGSYSSERQANFNVMLVRNSEHEFYRKEISEFLWNFEQWIEYCQFNGLTPKISEDPDAQRREVMFADNGMFYSDWEENGSSLYIIQLHIKYFNIYEDF